MKKGFYYIVATIMLLISLVACNNIAENTISSSPNLQDPVKNPGNNNGEQESSLADFEYIDNENGGITITKYIGNAESVIIPKTIKGKSVTKIGPLCFASNTSEIVYVKIPDSVTVIDYLAFYKQTALTTVVLPQNLTAISGGAFQECTALSNISLPSNLKELGSSAFEGCTMLKQINIPKTITDWGYNTFMHSGLESVNFENGLEAIGNNAFVQTNIKSITLPNTIKEIGSQAFGNCKNLESVILNEGLITIGDRAFGGESKLIEIIIPKSVKDITEFAFSGCSTLKAVKFEGNAPTAYTYANEEMPIEPINVHYTIYYHSKAEGFSSPEWEGYPTDIW